MSETKRPRKCRCGLALLLDGSCRGGCHLHRRPHTTHRNEDSRVRRISERARIESERIGLTWGRESRK